MKSDFCWVVNTKIIFNQTINFVKIEIWLNEKTKKKISRFTQLQTILGSSRKKNVISPLMLVITHPPMSTRDNAWRSVFRKSDVSPIFTFVTRILLVFTFDRRDIWVWSQCMTLSFEYRKFRQLLHLCNSNKDFLLVFTFVWRDVRF